MLGRTLPRLSLRILLPLLLLPLLGVGAYVRLSAPARSQIARNAAEEDGRILSQEAQDAYRQPWRGELWELAAEQALADQAYESALRFFNIAATLGELSGSGWLHLGDARLAAGDTQGALLAWQRALDLLAPAEAVHARRSELYLDLGEYTAAITEFEALAAVRPDHPPTLLWLGQLLAVEAPERALGPLERAAELDPALSQASLSLQRAVRRGSLLQDGPAYTAIVVGQALAAQDRWELALWAFETALDTQPDFADAWAFAGEARQQLGDPGYADLQRALRLDPDSLVANSLMALFWTRQERYDYALVYLEAAARSHPDSPNVQVELGLTQAAQGDIQAALAHLQQAVELAPRDPQIWRQLAGFSIRNDLQVSQIGLPAARQALLLDPADPASHDLVGEAYYLLDDAVIARRFYLRALELDPEFAPAHLHLAVLLLSAGDTEAGRAALDRVLELAPGSSLAEQAQRLLQYYFP